MVYGLVLMNNLSNNIKLYALSKTQMDVIKEQLCSMGTRQFPRHLSG